MYMDMRNMDFSEEYTPVFENTTGYLTVTDLYPHSIIIATIYIFTSVIGILGNGLVIIGVSIIPKLHTPTNVLIMNLAFADLLTCMALPFQTVGILSPQNQFPLPGYVCTIIGSVIYVTFTCSAVNLVLISINRWYVITRPVKTSSGMNTPKKQIAFAVLAWILASLYVYIPIYGFRLTEFSYYPPYKQCFTSLSERSDIYHNFLAVLIGSHIIIILVCYMRILLHVRRQRKLFRVFRRGSACSERLHQPYIKRLNKRELRVTKNLFVIVIAFICCTVPTAVAFATPGVLLAGLYTTAILYFNNCINPMLYAFKHPVFKKLFKRLVLRMLLVLGCKSKIVAEETDADHPVSRACVYAIKLAQVTTISNASSMELLNDI